MEVCASIPVASIRSFIRDLANYQSMLLSAKIFSRLSGILLRLPVDGVASNPPVSSFLMVSVGLSLSI